MPEIAEVETVRRTLLNKLQNYTIKSVEVIYPKIIQTDLTDFKNNIKNVKIKDINRIGKWLIFDLEKYYLLSHLRMEGKYFIKDYKDPIEKHEHIIFNLSNNTTLRYHDTRKFGRMLLINKNELYNQKEISKQGIEPISKDLTIDYLTPKLNKNIPIKALLLDQTIISGLGNIYVDEILYASNILPKKSGKDLNSNDINNIINNSKTIILKAIEMGGTTIKSYTSSLGVTGRFQQELKAHKQTICYKCNSKILKIKVGGRGTYYCPNCQK